MIHIDKILGLGKGKIQEKIKISDNGSLKVGRGDANDIVINIPYISRKHMVLHKMMENIYVEDVGSTYGTLLNGKKIMWAQVFKGDVISINNVQITVLDSEILIEVLKSEAPNPDERIIYVNSLKAQGRKQLPDKISFFESRYISHPGQLNVWENWTINVADCSLNVPMGIMETGKICQTKL